MDGRTEFDFMEAFVKERTFSDGIEREQLRALWTAYCLHRNIDCDTRLYDEELLELWNGIDKSAEAAVGSADWSYYERFDHYMGEHLS